MTPNTGKSTPQVLIWVRSVLVAMTLKECKATDSGMSLSCEAIWDRVEKTAAKYKGTFLSVASASLGAAVPASGTTKMAPCGWNLRTLKILAEMGVSSF